jgi:hypothetical protein
MADTVRSKFRLTDKQFAYLQAKHEEIERASIASKLGDFSGIDRLVGDGDYQRLFAGMTWDDVYDRYQDTPGYASSLMEEMHRTLQDGLSHNLPISRNRVSTLNLTPEQAAQFGLRKLNE